MATTNLGKVSVTPKGEYDPLVTYERLDVISHNGSSYIVKQASTGVTPIEGDFYALIAEKGDGGSFVKKAYKTYAAMDADKVNIPANSSVDVTNDPDESKNGAYIYDGAAFTRSQYDSKVVTDKIIADTAIAVQDAINNTAIEGGVLADTFVTITANGKGSVARNLRDVKSETMTINDFGGDFVAAGNWIKLDVGNYCYLEAGKDYTVSGSTDVYFNRYICRDGIATVIIPDGVHLEYLEKTDGSEVLHLENIDFKVLGHRGGVVSVPSELESQRVFKQTTGVVASSTLKNIKVYGLTDVNDIDSWSDDVGKTRVGRFIRVKVNKYSYIENLNTYGVALGVGVGANSTSAVHTEINMTGYNCETLVWLTRDEAWHTGSSKNLSIYNTDMQQTYWLGIDSGTGLNGKDCLLSEAEHTNPHEIHNIFAKNAVERSVYIQSINVNASNITDEGSYSMTGIKTNHDTPSAGSRSVARNIKSLDIKTPSTGMQIYGYIDYKMVGLDIAFSVVSPQIRAISFDNCVTVNVHDVDLKNAGLPLYQVGSTHVDVASFSSMRLVNCGSAAVGANLYQRRPSTATLGELHLKDITYELTQPMDLANIGAVFSEVDRVYLSNVECYAQITPFVSSDRTYVEAIDCRFTLLRDKKVSVMWAGAEPSVNFPMKANKFDFTVDYRTTLLGSVDKFSFKARFRKLQDTGKVNCYDHWSDIDINYQCEVISHRGLVANLGNRSFECHVSLLGSRMVFTYDATTKVSTVLQNLGGLLVNEESSTQVGVYISELGDLTVHIPTGEWVGVGNSIAISCKRF